MNLTEIRKVCVAGTDPCGDPDILFFKIEASPEWFESDQFHQIGAEIAYDEYDYHAPFVFWDNTDAIFHHMDCEFKFEWDTANIHEVL